MKRIMPIFVLLAVLAVSGCAQAIKFVADLPTDSILSFVGMGMNVAEAAIDYRIELNKKKTPWEKAKFLAERYCVLRAENPEKADMIRKRVVELGFIKPEVLTAAKAIVDVKCAKEKVEPETPDEEIG